MTIPPDRSDQIFSSQPIKGGPTPQAPGTGFQSQMQETPQASARGFAPTQGTNAVQAPQQFVSAATPSFDTLISQVGTSQDSLANVRSQLNTRNLQSSLTRSKQHLLRNKLSDATTYLRAANAKIGSDTPQMPSQAGARPIERFINFVTDGENQLYSARQTLMDMKDSGDQLRPADFLLVQIKLNQAQQEIEYSSTLLGKVIDSLTKTLNIQL